MYPIGASAKALFDDNQKQVIRIVMDTESTSYTITEADIISGSFSINRYSITGTRIEVGSACAGECKFKLKNNEGQWNNVKFEGAQLFVRIGIADWENYQSEADITWIPCGYFTVDAPVKNKAILSVEALDRMAKLDKPAVWAQLSSATTVQTLVARICELCGVLLANGSAIANLPNASYQIVLPTDADMTYRNLLQAACMLMGTCAFFNYNGQLEIKWYSSTSVSIDETKRYSHEMQENDITITGVYFRRENADETVEEYISGTNDYAIDISDNPLLGDNVQGVVTALGTALNGFAYRPVKATVKPAPYLYPMDMFSFLKAGTTYTGIVSNVTVGLNANTAIEGKGETNQDNGYATYGNFTNVQSKIIEYAKKKVDKEINERTLLLMNLNEMVMNSLGLYETTIAAPGGGYQYYFHDASTLADSSIIYTFGANGFAWTDDWNDGDPIWNYGITRDGNAIINMLSAYKISADIITAGTMRAVNLIFGTEPNTTELRTNDASTGALFDGTGVMQFNTKGEFFAKNVDSNSDVANQIRMRSNVLLNNVDTNQIGFLNKRNDVVANEFYANATDTSRDFWFYNNRPGIARNANNHYMGATATGYFNRLYNYKFNALTQSDDVISANDLLLGSVAERNYAALENRQAEGYRRNYLFMNAYDPNIEDTNADRSVIWLDNLKESDTSSEYIANRIYMNYQPNASSPANDFSLRNYDIDNNVTANYQSMSSSADRNSVYLYNDGVDGRVKNVISLWHSKSSLYNSISMNNNNNDAQTANSFSLTGSGADNHISFFNKFLSSTDTANETQFEGNSSGYISYWTKNYDRNNHKIANMIFMSSRPVSHSINGAVIPANNSLNLVNYQTNANEVVNSRFVMNDNMLFECQNRTTFSFIGNGKQFAVINANNGICIAADGVAVDSFLAAGRVHIVAPNGLYVTDQNGLRTRQL